jgi:hypothetical protein
MQDIVERLEKATGPDRELDALVYVGHYRSAYPDETDAARIEYALRCAPHYTSSIDSAIMLVPRGRKWRVGSHATTIWDGFYAAICPDILSGKTHESWCKSTPAIALCIAALKARQLMPERNTRDIRADTEE